MYDPQLPTALDSSLQGVNGCGEGTLTAQPMAQAVILMRPFAHLTKVGPSCCKLSTASRARPTCRSSKRPWMAAFARLISQGAAHATRPNVQQRRRAAR